MTKQEKNNDVWMMFLSAKVVSFNAAISACEKRRHPPKLTMDPYNVDLQKGMAS